MIAKQFGRRAFGTSANANVIKTAVYDQHVALGGKMVEFAGYWLPLQYPDGVKKECENTRNNATLFDVSHMGQVKIHGPDREKFVESIVVGDIKSLERGNASLSLITNDKGGIIDDTVITKEENTIAMVLNGACKQKDLKHMHQLLESQKMDAEIEHLENLSLFALQGPKAVTALEKLVEGVDLSKLLFMSGTSGKVAGMDCGITRCGYTGEDGFELSIDNSLAPQLMEALLDQEEVTPAGLGARDTLRIEAGLCLYGIDIDEDTTPVEASLLWTISKRRRAEKGFPGADIIVDQIKNKTATKKRVGLVIDGPPARAHVKLFADEQAENEIGEILSGTYSPTLSKPVAMGYIDKKFSKSGKQVYAKVRSKVVPATVSKTPFVPANYYRG